MQQWQIHEGEKFQSLRLIETEKPVPANGEVLVKMRAASLNYRDLLHASGDANIEAGRVPLSDGAGEVVQVGSGVLQWEIGDRVCGTFFRDWVGGRFEMKYHGAALGGSCDGVLAEYVVFPFHALVKMPEEYSFEEAATLPCAGVTAWNALITRGDFAPGDTVLLQGTGGVSIWGLQIAVAAGGQVFITSSSDEKLERCKAMGASATINYRSTPAWDKAVKTLTEKRGVEHVLDVAGTQTLAQSVNCVAAGGHVAQIGVLTGTDAPTSSLFALTTRNANLSGIYVGSREHFENFVRFLNVSKIKPIIDRAFDFSDAVLAYEYMESGAHFGKVVIAIS